MSERKRTSLHWNPVSWVGGMIMASSAAVIALLLGLELGLTDPSPYIGIFTYLVFPVFLVLGLLVFLYGMRRESLRRRREGTDLPHFPTLDLNEPRQRKWFVRALVGGTVGLILLALVSYNAFEFTESVTFCGKLCHEVMEPEHTAYLTSPHARVPCVDCHVGSGASWYVKSKLSGARQVLAVFADSYERPIPVPIKDLRPARETCEECHWPEKFFGAQLMQNPHFRYDEKNTAEQINLLVKTGGGREGGREAGIHWHMILSNRVTFVANDSQLQDIPWFKVTHADGTETEYASLDAPLSKAEIDGAPKHVIDCIGCHNRPSHQFPPPETSVDKAMAAGQIPQSLPWVKKAAVEVLIKRYPDRDTAHREIARALEEALATSLADPAARPRVAAAIDGVKAIYDRTVFPRMNVDWSTYPSNIGHRNWPGCFRCHDGRHATQDGKVLTRDCKVCHTLPTRGPLAPLGEAAEGSADWHPFPLLGRHESLPCTKCHQAGSRPAPTCAECHEVDRKAPMGSMGCDECHTTPQSRKPVADCKDCHEDLGGVHVEPANAQAACTSCHKPHDWKADPRLGADRSASLSRVPLALDTARRLADNPADLLPGPP
ncbi:MAG: NapC/NirT family cytochrome c [Deltaproteobacteria bacterium]|nr:NapC/NirT family cytochrome c [Deltaproteobacteria bacterium]